MKLKLQVLSLANVPLKYLLLCLISFSVGLHIVQALGPTKIGSVPGVSVWKCLINLDLAYLSHEGRAKQPGMITCSCLLAPSPCAGKAFLLNLQDGTFMLNRLACEVGLLQRAGVCGRFNEIFKF